MLKGDGYLRKLRVLLSILCFVLILNNVSFVYAEPTEDYKTFSQLDERWRNYVYVNGYTIGRSGCYITSFACLMAYANPELRDVSTFNPQTLASKCSFTSGGGLYPVTINNSDSTFHWETMIGISGVENVENKIKELLDQGKYVVVRSGPPIASRSTHFSPIVGWNKEADEPKIMDVAGGKHPEWKQWAPYVNRLDVCSSDNMSSKEALSGRENTDSSLQENTPQTEEEMQMLDDLIAEYELEGMPTVEGLPMQEDVEMSKREDLSLTEQINLGQIALAKSNDKIVLSEALSYILMFLGIVLILYSVLLLIALILDYVNAFVDLSLLSLLTFGRYRLVSREYFEENKLVGYDKYNKQTNVTPWSCLLRIIVICIIGMLITSGVIQEGIVFVLNKIVIWLSNIKFSF